MILVTGGAGYIGSHAVLVLLEAGFDVVVLDNLSNSSAESLRRVAGLTGKAPVFIEGDVRDKECLDRLFNTHPIDSVIHFAGLKAVGQSEADPLTYYDWNVVGALRLLEAMSKASVFKLVFSSSATVYGDPDIVPVNESAPLRPVNTYGATKLHIERMLADLCRSDSRWQVSALRYFNPVGAHESGDIGENPKGVPNNLMPYVAQVAVGKREVLQVFGSDYATHDGTGVRDYIHVMDLAEGHLAAMKALADQAGMLTVNLGTGKGCSVLEVLAAFKSASSADVPHRLVDRRPGDVAEYYADPSLAAKVLGWRATRTLEDMCRDQWRWQMKNPDGY